MFCNPHCIGERAKNPLMDHAEFSALHDFRSNWLDPITKKGISETELPDK